MYTYLYICIYNSGCKWSHCRLSVWCLGPSGLSSHSHLPPPCPLRHHQRAQFENHSALAFHFTCGEAEIQREKERAWLILGPLMAEPTLEPPPHPIFRWRNWSSGMLTLTQEFSGGKWWNHNYDLLIFSLVHFIKTLTPLPQLPSMEIVSGISVLRLSVHHSPYRLRACAHTPCLCILLILFPSKPTRINTSVSLFFSKSSQCFTPDPVMSPMCAGPASWVCTQGPWIWIDAF